jgi:toxin-antitoxin system PIN domain toxin
MTFLLDVNLLIALCDSRHSHHESAHRWFKAGSAWATCPLTENAFVRITSKVNFGAEVRSVAGHCDLLRTFCSLPTHSFWPDSVSLLTAGIWRDYERAGPSHLTDLYLVALAVKNNGKLATFDRRIPAHLIRGGKEALLVIS